MARRLKNLKVTEVSAVDSGAGRNVRMVLMKRDAGGGDAPNDAAYLAKLRKKATKLALKTGISPVVAFELVHRAATKGDAPVPQPTAKSAIVAPANPVTEVPQMSTVNKALDAMNRRVEKMLARGQVRSREAGIAKLAESNDPGDQELWQGYKKAAAGGLETVAEPQPASSGEAFAALEKKARKLQKRQPGLSGAGAFAAVYSALENRPLVERYRADFAAQGETVVKAEPAAPMLTAYEILERERQEHVRKAAMDGRAARELTLANNVRALRAMYPKFSEAKVRRLAVQQMLGGVDLGQLAGSLGYSGGP